MDRAIAPWPVEGQHDLRDGEREVDRGRARLEGCGLGARQVVDVGDHPAQGGGRRPSGLEPGEVGRHDAVDHRLELRLEDGRGRREVMGDVAGRPSAEHLGAFEPVGHAVERLGQFGRFEVVAPARAGAGLARLEPASGDGHVTQRPGQSAGDPGRDENDPDDADQTGHGERHVEQRQEPAVAPRAGSSAFERRDDLAIELDRRLVVGPIPIGGACPNAASVVPSVPITRISPPSWLASRMTYACARASPAGRDRRSASVTAASSSRCCCWLVRTIS